METTELQLRENKKQRVRLEEGGSWQTEEI